MIIEQTIEIPADHRLVIEVPQEVPAGPALVTFAPANESTPRRVTRPLPGGNARTIEEALKLAEAKAKDPNRKPLSRLFETCKGIFGGDGVAYQRAIRDEWD